MSSDRVSGAAALENFRQIVGGSLDQKGWVRLGVGFVLHNIRRGWEYSCRKKGR